MKKLLLVVTAIWIFLLGLGLAAAEKWPKDPLFSRPNELIMIANRKVVTTKTTSRLWAPGIGNKNRSQIDLEREEEDELLKSLGNHSIPIDLEKWGPIAERVISKTNVTEETKRVVRQVKKQRPGFFWTLFRVTFETVNETRAAIQQINDIVTAAVPLDDVSSKGPKTISTAAASSVQANGNTTTTTTTEAPFVLTRNGLLSLIRRNVRGLARLFNIEWKDAIDQSQINVKEFQRSLAKSIQPFLADNPNVF